jgi:membrane associated rhomboid family serine protease
MAKWFDKKFEKNQVRKTYVIEKNSGIEKIYRKFSITNWIIIANILVYGAIIIALASGISEENLITYIGLSGNDFFSGKIWTVFSSMFTHMWLPHLIFNMISLFFLGNFLEKIIGRKRFLAMYLIAGIFAGVFYAALSFFFGASPLGEKIFVHPAQYAVGASGAIFGVAGLLAILTPFMKVYLIVGPLIAVIIQALFLKFFPALPSSSLINMVLTLYIFISIFSMFSFNPAIRKIAIPVAMPFWFLPIVAIVPLMMLGLFVPLPIGNTAHLGGLIAGLLYGIYLKNKYQRKTQFIRKYFTG